MNPISRHMIFLVSPHLKLSMVSSSPSGISSIHFRIKLSGFNNSFLTSNQLVSLTFSVLSKDFKHNKSAFNMLYCESVGSSICSISSNVYFWISLEALASRITWIYLGESSSYLLSIHRVGVLWVALYNSFLFLSRCNWAILWYCSYCFLHLYSMEFCHFWHIW